MLDEPTEFDLATHEAIKALCAKGDELAEAGTYQKAISEYNKAWSMVPEPKNDWETSTWILAAIADACFLSGYLKSARTALEYAMTRPGSVGNPFLHLRYGQVLFEVGELDQAADELMRAYMGSGEEIFAKDDKRYFEFLKTRANL